MATKRNRRACKTYYISEGHREVKAVWERKGTHPEKQTPKQKTRKSSQAE